MPIIQVSTNLTNDEIADEFEKRFSVFLAEILDKPIERITVIINCGSRVCSAGDSSPYMLITIHAIDRFNEQNNPGYTDKILSFVQEETNLPGNKIHILYADLLPHMVGKGK